MNPKEISPETSPRMNRIKVVSRIFRVLIGILVVMTTLITALFFLASVKYALSYALGSGQPMLNTLHIAFSSHQTYTSPFDVPLPVFLIGALQLGLGGWCLILLNRRLGHKTHQTKPS
jgi:hypothetical protein